MNLMTAPPSRLDTLLPLLACPFCIVDLEENWTTN